MLFRSGNAYGFQILGNYTNDEFLISNYYAAALAFGTNNTERLRITSGGLVGIGTSTPDTTFSVQNVRSDTAGSGWFTYTALTTSGKRGLRVDTNNGFCFDYYNGSSWSQQAVIDSSGRVGIGTGSPQVTFHSKTGATTSAGIFESGSASGSWLSFADTGTSSYTRVQVGSVGNELVLRTTDLERARINNTGYLTGTVNGLSQGLYACEQYYRLNADLARADVSTAQSIFGVGVTLVASTVYEFEMVYTLSKTAGTTSHTIGVGFGGTATLNNIFYELIGDRKSTRLNSSHSSVSRMPSSA